MRSCCAACMVTTTSIPRVRASTYSATCWVRSRPSPPRCWCAISAGSGPIRCCAFMLLRRSTHILLEGVPEGLAPDEVRAALAVVDPDIAEVHHLHVWQLASGSRMATLHARLREGGDAQQALVAVQQLLRERFSISHVTVQIESSDCLDPESGCRDSERD